MSDNKGSVSLNKYISRRGICSRREADTWIDAGRLQINGKLAQKGNRVAPGDEVKLDGLIMEPEQKPIYIVCNKDTGVTCTTDRSDPSNIFTQLKIPYNQHLFCIGRTQKSTEGLTILTNDGSLVNDFIKKSDQIEIEYVVTLSTSIKKGFFYKISNGMIIRGTDIGPCLTEQIGKKIFKIKLTESINNQLFQMVQFAGHRISQLRKIRIQNISIHGLALNEWRYLTQAEIEELKSIIAK